MTIANFIESSKAFMAVIAEEFVSACKLLWATTILLPAGRESTITIPNHLLRLIERKLPVTFESVSLVISLDKPLDIFYRLINLKAKRLHVKAAARLLPPSAKESPPPVQAVQPSPPTPTESTTEPSFIRHVLHQLLSIFLPVSFQITIDTIDLECSGIDNGQFNSNIQIKDLFVDAKRNTENDEEIYSLDASIGSVSTGIKLIVSTNSGVLALIEKLKTGIVHRPRKTELKCQVGKIGVKTIENDHDDQPIVETTKEENLLDIDMVIDENNKAVATVNAQNVSVFAFPKSMTLLQKIAKTLTSNFVPPKTQVVPPAASIPSVPAFTDVWLLRPWRERFPQLETVIRPPPVVSRTNLWNDLTKRKLSYNLDVKLTNMKFGAGCARIAGNEPMILAELNGSAGVLATESLITSQNVGFLAQLSYLNRNRGVVQPLFEPDGLNLSLNLKKPTSQPSELSVNFPRRIEMLMTPRLMEVVILLGDAFRQTPVAVPKSMMEGVNFTFIEDPIPDQPGTIIQLRNALPQDLKVTQICGIPLSNEKQISVPSGRKAYVTHSEDLAETNLCLQLDYNGRKWTYDGIANQGMLTPKGWKEFKSCRFISEFGSEWVTLGVQTIMKDPKRIQLTIFSPVWVVNNTGLDLVYYQHQYRDDESWEVEHHAQQEQQPMLMNYGITELKVRKMDEKVEWTTIPMNKTGRLDMKGTDQTYPLGVEIHFNCEGLTKQIILTPYFVLDNETPYSLKVRELMDRHWTTLGRNSRTPFWPKSTEPEDRGIVFKLTKHSEETTPFFYQQDLTEDRSVILRSTDDKFGLKIDPRSTPTSMMLCCHQLDPEDIPFVIINDTNSSVTMAELTKPGNLFFDVKSSQSLYFTFSNHVKSSTLGLFSSKKKISDDLLSSTFGSYGDICWTNFMYGRQRIVLITDQTDLAKELSKQQNAQPVNMKISVSIEGFGMNLVADELGDIMYVSVNKRRGVLDSAIKLDMIAGKSYVQVDLAVQTIQIDCQMENVVHQTIVYQPYGTSDRPYLTLSAVQSLKSENSCARFQKLKVDICPTRVCVDLQAILAVVSIIKPRVTLNEALAFETNLIIDRLFARYGFEERTSIRLNQASHFEFDDMEIHIPNLGISFTTVKTTDFDSSMDINPWIEILNQMIEFQDIKFDFKPLCLKNAMVSTTQLSHRIIAHFCHGIGKHITKLAIGITTDKIKRLFLSIGHGLEGLFCNPLTDAIGGNKTNSRRSLSIRFRIFYSQLIGGISGFVADITEGIGQGIDSLTGDVPSQRLRTELSRPSTDSADKMIQSFKALIKGITRGFTGIVIDPMEGSKKGCCGGFKGFMKGFFGIVTKPLAGCLNLTTGICRSAQYGVTEDPENWIQRKRPPRLMEKTGIISPYSRYKAEGLETFNRVDGGHLRETDTYICHALVIEKKPRTLIITNNRLAIVSVNGNIKWQKLRSELPGLPELLDDDELFVDFSKEKKKIEVGDSPSKRGAGNNGKNIKLAPDQNEFKKLLADGIEKKH